MRRNNTLKMVILIISLLFSWLFIGGVFMLSFYSLFSASNYSELLSTIISFIGVNIPHIILFIFSIVVTHIALNTKICDMVRDKKYSLRCYILTALIALTIFSLSTIAFSRNITIGSKSLSTKVVMVFFALAITPLQCFSEEYLFRVVIARLFNSDKNLVKLILSIASGIIFLFLHKLSNPEFLISPSIMLNLYYFLFGFLSMLLGLFLEDFTFPIIIHSINNLFIVIVCNYAGSPLESASFFISSTIPSPLISSIAMIMIFALTFFCAKKNRGELHGKEKEINEG